MRHLLLGISWEFVVVVWRRKAARRRTPSLELAKRANSTMEGVLILVKSILLYVYDVFEASNPQMIF